MVNANDIYEYILHQRELKAKTKNIAIVKARNVVLQQQQNKVKQLIFPSNKNSTHEFNTVSDASPKGI